MKCPFCVADNPSYANFCMNCGSPLDLKACKECGGINRKTVSHCQMCNASFDETVPAKNIVPPPPSLPSNAQEAEALAKETQSFKQLFAELEHDVNRQLRPVKATKASAPSSMAQQLYPPAAPIVDIPTIVEPPSYMREILSERAAKNNYRITSKQQLIIIAVFLVVVGFYGYYNAFGHQKSQAGPKPQTSSKTTSDTVETKPAPPEELPATKSAAPPASETVPAGKTAQ